MSFSWMASDARSVDCGVLLYQIDCLQMGGFVVCRGVGFLHKLLLAGRITPRKL